MKSLFYPLFEAFILFLVFGLSFKAEPGVVFLFGAMLWVALFYFLHFSKVYVNRGVIGFCVFLTALAFGRFFSDFNHSTAINFLLYYVWFLVPSILLLHLTYSRSRFPGFGLIFISFTVSVLYLFFGVFDWNQYQSVGNIVALGLLASLFGHRNFASFALLLSIFKIPSFQSLGISIFLLIFRAVWTSRFVFSLLFLILFSISAYLVYIVGLLEPRHFTILARVSERFLIFSHYLSLVEWHPQLDWQSSVVTDGSVFITGRAHGVWLQTLLNFGWVLGGFFNIMLFASVFILCKRRFYFVLPFFIPYLVSTDINPLKYLVIASLLISSYGVRSKLVSSRHHG